MICQIRRAGDISRRAFHRLVLAGGGLGAAHVLKAADEPALDAARPFDPGPSGRSDRVRYKADATILLLSVPLFRRSGVGEGEASLIESANGGLRRAWIQFFAHSDPSRAGGLKRMGLIREACVEKDASPISTSYFGVMTSSPEKSLDEARKALETNPNSVPYSAIQGSSHGAETWSTLSRFQSEFVEPGKSDALVETARQSLTRKAPKRSRWNAKPEAAPAPFLQTLLKLVRDPAPKAERRYVYDEREYVLQVEKALEQKTGLTRVSGRNIELGSGSKTTFRIWMSPGYPLPYRIEYQARSFLRLTFVAEKPS
jgi:hypothetical protein